MPWATGPGQDDFIALADPRNMDLDIVPLILSAQQQGNRTGLDESLFNCMSPAESAVRRLAHVEPEDACGAPGCAVMTLVQLIHERWIGPLISGQINNKRSAEVSEGTSRNRKPVHCASFRSDELLWWLLQFT